MVGFFLTKRVESATITNVREVKQKFQYYGYYLKIFQKIPLKGGGDWNFNGKSYVIRLY